MVKQPKKFVIVDDSSPAVARLNVQKAGPGLIFVSGNIRSLLHLAALLILPDERLVIRFFFCGVSSNSCVMTFSSEDIFSTLTCQNPLSKKLENTLSSYHHHYTYLILFVVVLFIYLS